MAGEEEEGRGLDGWMIFGDQSVGVVGDGCGLMGDRGSCTLVLRDDLNGNARLMCTWACLDCSKESILRSGTACVPYVCS